MNSVKYINFIYRFDSISANIFIESFKEIQNSDQEIIPIRIKSPGGYVHALQEILDVVDTSNKPIATFVTGMACSCGAALALSGSDGLRFIGPNAEFMIHQVFGVAYGKTSDVKAEAELMEKMTEKFVYSRADNAAKKESGYTRNLIKENFNADFSMFANEAISHGFFDGIGEIDDIKNMNLLLEKYNR